MRMAFGLVSLLVTVALIVWMFSFYTGATSKPAAKARDQARQLSGRDEDGAPATDSIQVDAQDKNGKMQGVVVTSVTPGGAMEKQFGLQKGDVITQIGQLGVRDTLNDLETAKAMLLQAYQRGENLTVLRGWETVTLPLPPGSPALAPGAPQPGAAAPPPVTSAPPAASEAPPAEPKPSRGLEGQLDLIRKIPQH